MENESKVIPLKKEYSLFPPDLRQQLGQDVDKIEQVISNYLVAKARAFGERLGQKLMRRVFS